MTDATTGGMTARLLLTCAALAFVTAGCVHSNGPDDLKIGQSERPDGASRPIAFSFESLDKRQVDSASVAGKPTVLVFMTTWDLSSQAQIDYLVPMSRRDGDAVNYVMVALQEAKDRSLVEVFVEGLKVPFLAAMADEEIVGGGGPFGPIKAVPTVVVLDRASRMVWRHVGLAKPEEIREGLTGL